MKIQDREKKSYNKRPEITKQRRTKRNNNNNIFRGFVVDEWKKVIKKLQDFYKDRNVYSVILS